MINTQVVEIDPAELGLNKSLPVRIYTCLEGQNPGGSIKDHMAKVGLLAMHRRGDFKGDKILTEASAGSTARSLAYYARELGIRCSFFVPDSLPEPARQELRALGAQLHPVPMDKAMELFEEYCRDPKVVPFNQLQDTGKRVFYHGLGKAIWKAVGNVDLLLGAVGTSHSLLGVAEGMPTRPHVGSAEPAQGHVSGIRNIDLVRHGPKDPCVPSLFDERFLVPPTHFFSSSTLGTSVGKIIYPDSFRVILGALEQALEKSRASKVFLLGAANRAI